MRGVGHCCAWIAALALMAAPAVIAEKRGAGLFLCHGGEVLLLQRRSKHNDMTWGLPGGNAEADDASLLQTAAREANEELGAPPAFEVLGQVPTERGGGGKGGKGGGAAAPKLFTVFVCSVGAAERARYAPVLNAEHRAWRWVPFGELPAMRAAGQLHPVVEKLTSKRRWPDVERLLAEAAGAGA